MTWKAGFERIMQEGPCTLLSSPGRDFARVQAQAQIDLYF